MKITPRPYQQSFKSGILGAWDAGFSNVLGVLATGAGKTFVFASIMREHTGPSVAIAHRQELVGQISTALAQQGVRHSLIAPDSVIRLTVQKHVELTGRSFYTPTANVAVAGVDTLLRRKNSLNKFCDSVTLWVMDEAHHILEDNKWGKATKLFPRAKGLGVTATPTRADGYGLGRHASGVMDYMVVGIGMREIIDMGYLSDYRIMCAQSDLKTAGLELGANGDFKPRQLAAATRDSHIVGDIVDAYLEYAPGKLGVTFIPDMETGCEVAEKFNAAGVRAEMVTYKTQPRVRDTILKSYARREIMQIVNIDLFGEGFDCPAMQVASFGRKTMSYPLYVQQFGRPIRLDGTGERALIIDHVGNVMHHGLPDKPRRWTLDGRSKNDSLMDDIIPLRECLECASPYERTLKSCPLCGTAYVPAARNSPDVVDGDLTELDPATLASMRSAVEKSDMPASEFLQQMVRRNVPPIGHSRLLRKHDERKQAQQALRQSIAWWAGYQRARGRQDDESYKRFFWKFEVDVMTAQTLKTREALALADKINTYIGVTHDA